MSLAADQLSFGGGALVWAGFDDLWKVEIRGIDHFDAKAEPGKITAMGGLIR